MKTIKYFTLRLMAVAAIAIAFALPAKAQVTPFTSKVDIIYCRICQSVPLSIIIPIMSIFHVRHYQSATRQP